MENVNFLKLNNYFLDDKSIDDLVIYLTKGDFPASVNTNFKRNRYRQRFRNFKIDQNRIFYQVFKNRKLI